MDRNERFDSPLVAVRTALAGFQAEVWTALPAIVESYDPVKRTVSVQPTIQAQTQDKTTGAWSNVTLAILPDVPVLFPGAGDFLLTFPVKAGDEGLVVFASRCIDAFWQQGGVQPQAEQRMHDLSDGIFLPGALSQKQEIPNVAPDSVQLRSKDGLAYVELAPAGVLNLVAPGGINFVGPITFNGIHVTNPGAGVLAIGGKLTATGDVVAGQGTGDEVGALTHTHSIPTGQSGAPTPGT